MTFSHTRQGRETQRRQRWGHTREIRDSPPYPPERTNGLVKAHIEAVELRGLEPLTFSLRTRRATDCAIAPDRDSPISTQTLPPSGGGYLARLAA